MSANMTKEAKTNQQPPSFKNLSHEEVQERLQARLNSLVSLMEDQKETSHAGRNSLLEDYKTRISELVSIAGLIGIELNKPEVKTLSVMDRIGGSILNMQ